MALERLLDPNGVGHRFQARRLPEGFERVVAISEAPRGLSCAREAAGRAPRSAPVTDRKQQRKVSRRLPCSEITRPYVYRFCAQAAATRSRLRQCRNAS